MDLEQVKLIKSFKKTKEEVGGNTNEKLNIFDFFLIL